MHSASAFKLKNTILSVRNMSHKVFVYGTLKKGEPNNHWLTKKENGTSKFICEAKTTSKYPLIIATRYNIPFLLHKPGMGHAVKGEIYEVDELMLKNLDVLEDHPKFYTRTIDRLQPLDGSDMIECWVYFLYQFKPALLELAMMEDYSSTGDHGLVYAERSKRDPNYSILSEIR